MRIAAVWVPDFPLQALRRAVPELAESPIAIAAGPTPRDRVVAVSAEAADLGVRPGMTAAQARQRSMQVMVRITPAEVAAAAEAALVDAARSLTPRVRRQAPGELLLDMGGSVLRWGSEGALAERLWRACRRVGLEACVGIAGSVGVARIAARAPAHPVISDQCSVISAPTHPGERGEGRGERKEGSLRTPITDHRSPVVPHPGARTPDPNPQQGRARQTASTGHGPVLVPAGEERLFLAPLPTGVLEPSPPAVAALRRWGIGAVGGLAALPRSEVILRLGPEGETLHRLACGDDGRAFIPDPPVAVVREGVSFDDPLGALEPFLFVLHGLLSRLATRLELRGEGFAEVRLELGLEGGERYQTAVCLVAPTREVTAVLPLLRLRLESAPPGAPVEGVTVAVQPGVVRLAQGLLFGPPTPAPGKLATALVRLAALVGPDRVGAPARADTHRPATFGVLPFAPPPWKPQVGRESQEVESLPSPPARWSVIGDRCSEGEESGSGWVLRPPSTDHQTQPLPGHGPVLRALRPVLPAQVTLAGQRPVAVQTEELGGTVVAWAGPYRTTGDWWTERPFSRDDYDVAITDGSLLRLCHDRLARAWFVDGVYD
ncbi:MAG: DNA polymerase Y family protein [Thermoanaerobaculaceae bacterium]|jgi:protein ImuB|nr:DNA polymerase Y family protein [Thermoanaerobaculaceae bacterium]